MTTPDYMKTLTDHKVEQHGLDTKTAKSKGDVCLYAIELFAPAPKDA